MKGHAQSISLEEVVLSSKSRTLRRQQANKSLESSKWRLAGFRAQQKPEIRVDASIPTFYRTINPITQPDGTIRYVRISQATNSVGIKIRQHLPFLGGTLSAGTSLQRTDNFSGNKSSYFLSTPLQISYSQNSLRYNDFYWQRKLENLYFDIANRKYEEDLELATFESVLLFLEGLDAQTNISIASENLATADTLLSIAKKRADLGTVPQSDILQLELNLLLSRKTYSELLVKKKIVARKISDFLELTSAPDLTFVVPPAPSILSISYEEAIANAKEKRPDAPRLEAARLAAEQEVAKAKHLNRLDAGILVNLGTQQTDPNLLRSYRNLQNQQYIGFSLSMPIQDWGYRKSVIFMAEANRDLTTINALQEAQIFEQEILTQVLLYNQARANLVIAQQADTIAGKKLMLARSRYLLGKLDISQLNQAINEHVRTKQESNQMLSDCWRYLFTLRRLTLTDI